MVEANIGWIEEALFPGMSVVVFPVDSRGKFALLFGNDGVEFIAPEFSTVGSVDDFVIIRLDEFGRGCSLGLNPTAWRRNAFNTHFDFSTNRRINLEEMSRKTVMILEFIEISTFRIERSKRNMSIKISDFIKARPRRSAGAGRVVQRRERVRNIVRIENS
jgi:hypothetical protein